MNTSKKALGAVASATLLAMTSASAFAAVNGTVAADEAQNSRETFASESALQTSQVQQAYAIEGTFTYSQDVVTSNETLSNVFAKAAAAMCTDLPQYGCDCVGSHIAFQARNQIMDAYVADLTSGEGSSVVMGCSCATNGAGGGAIANAEVGGITLAAVANMMNVI